MMHWRAKQLLPSLLDDTLEEDVRLDLRVHVASCARCRRMQRELELSESLLRQLPTSLLPVEYSPTSYGRLVSLSRWYDDPAIATPDRWRAPILSAASVVAVLAMAISASVWSPIVSSSSGVISVSSVAADSSYLPVAWTTNRH